MPSPLFHPTPCMPSPYSIPPHACPPLFHPTPCMPSPYSIPLHACPPPIPSHSMHALPYSIPAHACLPRIISQPMHTLSIFSPSSHMQPQYSISAHVCPPNSLSLWHIHLDGMFLLWNLHICHFWICSHWEYHIIIIIIIIYLAWQLEHHFITLWHMNVCCFHSHELHIRSTIYISHNYHLHCSPLFICEYHTFIYIVTYTHQQTSYTYDSFLYKMLTLFNW